MSRKFMPESEALSQRMAEVLYHAGEPALWALIQIEAGECPEKQADALYTRMFNQPDSLLRKFSRLLQRVYVQQAEALDSRQSFSAHRQEALNAIAEASGVADEIVARSGENAEKRLAQGRALRGIYDMKELNER